MKIVLLFLMGVAGSWFYEDTSDTYL